MDWENYISFVDIGGLTYSTYHNVFFKKYSLTSEGNKQFIVPALDIDFVSVDIPTAKSAKDLLIDLLCLYNKMTKLSPDEMTAAIIDWCDHNVHPYDIEKFYELFHDDSGFVNSTDVITLARFSEDDFKKDLIALGTHFNFFYALDMIRFGSPSAAMKLYEKYNGWSEYSCFEKFKKLALQESSGDNRLGSSLFMKYIEDNNAEFMKILVKKFYPFKISLTIDPITNKPTHRISVDSIFDIVWFTFSQMVTEDASYISLEDNNYFDDFNDDDTISKALPVTRCPICGDYIKKIKNKKYCNKPECQRQRNAIKSRNYTLRKKLEIQ